MSDSEDKLDVDRSLEAAILDLLKQRGDGKTICPSDAARKVDPDNWRQLMERTRQVAGRLVEAGEIVVTQRGRVVDLSLAKGPIRLRRVTGSSAVDRTGAGEA